MPILPRGESPSPYKNGKHNLSPASAGWLDPDLFLLDLSVYASHLHNSAHSLLHSIHFHCSRFGAGEEARRIRIAIQHSLMYCWIKKWLTLHFYVINYMKKWNLMKRKHTKKSIVVKTPFMFCFVFPRLSNNISRKLSIIWWRFFFFKFKNSHLDWIFTPDEQCGQWTYTNSFNLSLYNLTSWHLVTQKH